MPIHPETPPNKNQSPTTGPRFYAPDRWNQTYEEIEFTPWEQDVITINPGQAIKSIIPKPRKPRGRPPSKPKDSTTTTKAKAPTRTYKSRSKATEKTKDAMETKLPRKPMGKRVLPSPETLPLTRLGYLDPIERAAERANNTTETKPDNKKLGNTKKLENTKKAENPKKPDNIKKLENKRKAPSKSKPLPRPAVPTDPVPQWPGRHKKWYEDIDEDLLKGTLWARQLDRNSLQREFGNPRVLFGDRWTREASNDRIAGKKKTAAMVKAVSPPPLQTDNQKNTGRTTPVTSVLERSPLLIPKPTSTVSAHEDQQPQAKFTSKLTEKSKPQSFGFESFPFEDVSEKGLEGLGSPISGRKLSTSHSRTRGSNSCLIELRIVHPNI